MFAKAADKQTTAAKNKGRQIVHLGLCCSMNVTRTSRSLKTQHACRQCSANSSSLGVFAAFNNEHPVLGGAKHQLTHRPSLSQLVCSQFLESWHNASAGSHGYQLDLNTSNPSHSRQVVGHQQVVGFVIKAPLANDKRGSRVLALLDHVCEVLLLCCTQIVKLFNRVYVHLQASATLSLLLLCDDLLCDSLLLAQSKHLGRSRCMGGMRARSATDAAADGPRWKCLDNGKACQLQGLVHKHLVLGLGFWRLKWASQNC